MNLCCNRLGNLHFLRKTLFNCVQLRQSPLSHYPVNDAIYGLDEDKQKLRETAFNFYQKELAPFAKDIDKNDNYP